MQLPATWAERDATLVAPDLLHKWVLIGSTMAKITEVEAYTADDPASHSFRGVTRRTAPMFGPPGRWYVYLVYGIHHCLNVVTGADGDGQAVLLRSVVVGGIPSARTRGPGRLCKELGVDLSWNHRPVELFDDGGVPPGILVTPRIGITKAADWPRRYVVAQRNQ
jgi:DNA-3-methyladenine glycosylase